MNTKFVDFAELLCKWMQFRTENRDQLKSYSPPFANICSAIFKFWRMTLWFVLEIVFLTWFSDKFIISYFIFYVNTIIEQIYCVKWQI